MPGTVNLTNSIRQTINLGTDIQSSCTQANSIGGPIFEINAKRWQTTSLKL